MSFIFSYDAGAFKNLNVKMAKALADSLALTAEEIVSETKNRCPVAANILKNSYTYSMSANGESTVANFKGRTVARIKTPDTEEGEYAVNIGTPLSYGADVEWGTKPHFPPVEAIKEWIRQKGLSADTALAGTYSIKTHRRTGGKKIQDENEQLAWAISIGISKKGTKPHPHLFPGFQEGIKSFGAIVREKFQEIKNNE